jgi:preprotein translocase SecE subunit
MAGSGVKADLTVAAKVRDFWRGCVEELKKVSKPTRQETIQATVVTLILMLFVAMALGLMDVIFYNLMSAVLLGGEQL